MSMPIYTRTGDRGMTSLFGGKRVLKCEDLVDVYGSLDELNSWIGFLIASEAFASHQSFFTTVQEDIFLIGSVLAGWQDGDLSPLPLRVADMEQQMNVLEQSLPSLTAFILPGGTQLASQLHIVRAITRRVERQAVAYAKIHSVDERILMYINRLSDLFFLLAREVNVKAKSGEHTWKGIDRTVKKKYKE